MSQATPPALLYKYLPCERSDVVEACRIAFSTFAALNDPFEFVVQFDDNAIHDRDNAIIETGYTLKNLLAVVRTQPGGDEVAEQFSRFDSPQLREQITEKLSGHMANSKAKADALLNQTKNDYRRFRNGDMVVFCCSANPTSVPMWAHYTSHAGFQIGFRPLEMFNLNNFDGTKTAPLQITYGSKPPLVGADFSAVPNLLSQKMTDWSYEAEWRYFSTTPLDFEAPTPGAFLYPFNPKAIAEITFGLRAADEFISTVKRHASASGINCTYLQVVADETAYALTRKPC